MVLLFDWQISGHYVTFDSPLIECEITFAWHLTYVVMAQKVMFILVMIDR